jgi:hypothetical protein
MRLPALLAKALVALCPWCVRKRLLRWCWGYRFAPGSRIGWPAWVYPRRLVLGPGARIARLNVVVNCDLVELGEGALIERGNWITGHPPGSTAHFAQVADRDPSLVLGAHAAITKGHHLDATDRIEIGAFTTIAGYGSQISAPVGRTAARCASAAAASWAPG